MATVNDRASVDILIAGNGEYHDNDCLAAIQLSSSTPCICDARYEPKAYKIVEYHNFADGPICYGIIFEGEESNKYRESVYVRSPKTIWERES